MIKNSVNGVSSGANIDFNFDSELNTISRSDIAEVPIPEPPSGGLGNVTILEPSIKKIPAWTIEDFENALPHGWIFNNYYENPFTYRRAIAKIDEYAQSIGFKGFKAEMRDYVKECGKKPLEGDYENCTEWSDQPLQLKCGTYECTDAFGVVCTKGGVTDVICPHPLMVSGRLINLESGEIRLEIAFKRIFWRKIVVERTVLATANKIVDLAKHGIAVDSENAKSLVKFISELEAFNYEAIPERHSTERLGWTASGMFLPYSDNLTFDGAPSFKPIFDTFKPHGDRERYLEVVSNVAKASTIARIVLATSLASALVKPLGALPFFLHIWGRSGNGKTMMLKLAASLWASPNDSDGYIRNFNTTSVGLETAAGFFNSVPLCIDELQIAKKLGNFDDTIYMLSEGAGRSRGNKDGSMRSLKSWRNAIITTGEMPISSSNSGAGALNRIIEIACGDERLLPDYRTLADCISENWGFVGREFIQLLTPEVIRAAKTVQERYRADLEANSTTEKLALSASLILTADRIAERHFWHSGAVLSIGDIAQYLPTKADVDTNRRALEWLYGTIIQHSRCFETDGDIPHEIWGEFKTTTDGKKAVAIISSVFDNIVRGEGFNPASFRSWMVAEGVARCSSEGKTTVNVKINGRSTRCVYVILPDEDETDNITNKFKVSGNQIMQL